MKKVLVILILFLTIISVDVVYASSPAKLKNYSSSSTLKQGETVVVDTKVIYGNAVGYPYPYVEYSFNYDADVFEFVSFKSDYNLSYDSKQMLVKGDNSFILENHINNEDEAFTLWTLSFKVKDDAKIGEANIADQIYSIIENHDIDEDVIKDDNKDINIYLVSGIILLIIVTTGGLIYLILKIKKA